MLETAVYAESSKVFAHVGKVPCAPLQREVFLTSACVLYSCASGLAELCVSHYKEDIFTVFVRMRKHLR